jgi:Arc/MetJ-type ribon-helix-helix transcriptional regulator
MRKDYILQCVYNEHPVSIIGDKMNINLGAPYESILARLIEREYAGNQTEAIRQALVAYEQKLEEEEMRLVHKAVEMEMQDIRAGRVKTIPWAEVKKKAGL